MFKNYIRKAIYSNIGSNMHKFNFLVLVQDSTFYLA